MSNTSLNFFKYNISEQEYYFGRIIFNSTSEKSPASAGGEMNRPFMPLASYHWDVTASVLIMAIVYMLFRAVIYNSHFYQLSRHLFQ